MTRNDYDYYAMRAGQEDRFASNATCHQARECHRELANAYRFRCALLRQQDADGRSGTMVDYDSRTRQPITTSSTAVLAPRPAMAPTPLFRA